MMGTNMCFHLKRLILPEVIRVASTASVYELFTLTVSAAPSSECSSAVSCHQWGCAVNCIHREVVL